MFKEYVVGQSMTGRSMERRKALTWGNGVQKGQGASWMQWSVNWDLQNQ